VSTQQKPSIWPHPVRWIARNLFGYVLIILGIIQLFVPGQGILTILAGLAIADWPGKCRFFRWLRTFAWFDKADHWMHQKFKMRFPEHPSERDGKDCSGNPTSAGDSRKDEAPTT
jgi:hypothetical protein